MTKKKKAKKVAPAVEEAPHCEGDKVAGFNVYEKCYATEGCPGCPKCIIKCSGCGNCTKDQPLRQPEVGDFVVVKPPIISLSYTGPKWTPAMDSAIGRVAWVRSGNPVEGFHLKFSTTQKDILDQYIYPPQALRLAMPEDRAADTMIRTTKERDFNETV